MSTSTIASPGEAIQWLQKMGIEPSMVAKAKVEHQLFSFPIDGDTSIEMGGMAAKEDLHPDTELLRLPYKCFLNAHHSLLELGEAFEQSIQRIEKAAVNAAETNKVDEARQERLKKLITEKSALLDAEFVMACFLMKERFDPRQQTSPSRFHEYVHSLPAIEDMTTPEFCVKLPSESEESSSRTAFTSSLPDEVRVAFGTRVRAEKAIRRCQKLRRRFDLLEQCYFSNDRTLFAEDVFTFEHWMWSTAIMASRCFHFTSPKGKCEYPWRWRALVKDDQDENESSSDEEEEDEEYEEEEEEEDDYFEHNSEVDPVTGLLKGMMESPQDIAARKAAKRERRRGPGLIGQAMSDDESGTDSEADSSEEDDDDDDDGPKRKKGFETFSLIPFADMFNHQVGASRDFEFESDSMTFVMKSGSKPIKKGEQVFIRYNNMDHWKFAKYYGFVPSHPAAAPSTESNSDQQEPCGPHDAFPLLIEAPPKASVEMGSSIVDITRYELFDGGSLSKHCFVTSKGGPNRSLLSALRLKHLTENEIDTYVNAFNKEPLSIRNEWKAHKTLLVMIKKHITEMESNMAVETKMIEVLREKSPAGELSTELKRLMTVAHPVRSRDLAVLKNAEKKVGANYKRLCEVQYYGSSVHDILKTNIIHQQFNELKAMGRLPKTREEHIRAGLGLLPAFSSNRHPDAAPAAVSVRGQLVHGDGKTAVDGTDIEAMVAAIEGRVRQSRNDVVSAAMDAAF